MVIDEEDNISLDEVVEICHKTKNENIQIRNNDPKMKTYMFLLNHNLIEDDIRKEIKNLSKADYYKGPCEDKNPNHKHPVWIFIKTINNLKCLVYIKIKIINHKRTIIVYSFHEEGMHDETE